MPLLEDSPGLHGSRFREFRSKVARQSITLALGGHDYGDSTWVYFEHGPRDEAAVPIVLLHGVEGTANTFFEQVLTLTAKGHRVIAAQYPPHTSHAGWLLSAECFLNHVHAPTAHILGDGLGAFLALLFARRHPRRVRSLMLSNGFSSNRDFDFSAFFLGEDTMAAKLAGSTVGAHVFRWMPEFLIKRCLLSRLPSGQLSTAEADAVDFVVREVETLTQARV